MFDQYNLLLLWIMIIHGVKWTVFITASSPGSWITSTLNKRKRIVAAAAESQDTHISLLVVPQTIASIIIIPISKNSIKHK